MISMSLSSAADSLQATMRGKDIQFCGCNTDSRSVQAGEMFIALHGANFDGHEFIQQAKERGAAVAMVQNPSEEHIMPLLVVENTRTAMGGLAAHWRKHFDIPVIA